MNKRLISFLIFGILIISFSVAYYFFAFLPAKEKNRLDQEAIEKQEKRAQQDLENNIKCKEAGDRLYKLDISKLAEGWYYDSTPEFRFNKNLNTCLFKGRLTNYIGYSENFIKDVYSNKYIYPQNMNLEIANLKEAGSTEDFNKKYSELFEN